MSAIVSVLNDDERMMRGIVGEIDPQLHALQAEGLPMSLLTRLLESGLLDSRATDLVRSHLISLPDYAMARVRLSPVRTVNGYPFSRLPMADSEVENDRQWQCDGNLYHYHVAVGGKDKADQSLYLWLCLGGGRSTPQF